MDINISNLSNMIISCTNENSTKMYLFYILL